MEFPLLHCEAFCSVAKWATPSRPLESALQQVVDTAHTAWPSIQVTDDAFVRFVAARVDPPSNSDLPSFHELQLGDLYLACACAQGHRLAIRVFQNQYLGSLGGVLAPHGSAELQDDVKQILLERLLVSRGDAPPKIVDYAGRGKLSSWTRVAAVRTALSLRRSQHAVDKDGDARIEAAVAPANPEVDVLRQHCGTDFDKALRDAFASLPTRDRLLLKLHYVDGLSVDRIAELHEVHRVSASRWLSAARTKVLVDVRRLLRQRLAYSDSQLGSVVMLLGSRLDVSLRSLLVK